MVFLTDLFGFIIGKPRTAREAIWLLAGFAAPVAAFLAYDGKFGAGSVPDLSPYINMWLACALGVGLGMLGLFLRWRCCLSMIVVSIGLFQYSHRDPDYDWGPVLWGDQGVWHIAPLGDGSVLLCGPGWVRLDRNATPVPNFYYNFGEARDPSPLSDGRTVLAGENARTFVVVDAEGRSWYRQEHPVVGHALAAAAAPTGSVLIAWDESFVPGSSVAIVSYSSKDAGFHWDDERLPPSRILRPSASEPDKQLRPLQAVLFSDGSAAVYWASDTLVWYAPDGGIRVKGVQPFSSSCKGSISVARDGMHAYLAAEDASCKFEMLRLDATGTPDPAFTPDRGSFKALGIAVQQQVHVLEIPGNGFLAWNYHQALHFDASGRRDRNFEIRTDKNIRDIVWTSDRLRMIEENSLRQFLPNGNEDPSFRTPLLQTKYHKGKVTTTLRNR